MKKSLLCIIFLFVTFFAFSQTLLNESFSVVPKDIYIGDLVEIRYNFSTNINLLEQQGVKISFPENTKYEIISSTLSGDNGNYTLEISCIPWETGPIDLPKIELSEYIETISTSFAIDVPSFTVLSIVERTNKKDLQAVAAPVLVPGTTWFIYFVIILGLLIITLFVYFLFHSKKVISNWNNYLINLQFKKNLKKTVKRIKKLNKKSAKYDDKMYAKELSAITRDFLSTRFKHNFHSVVSSKIQVEINSIFQDLLPEELLDKIEEISNILTRCDYVRFSGNQEKNAELSFVERSKISDTLIEAFSLIASQRSIEC